MARRVLWTAIAAHAVGFAALSWSRHLSLATGRFDLGNMTQAVWSTAHGRPLEMTGLHGGQISRLGAHVDPILVAFAPLWWLWPDPSLLLVAQAVALALGALPVFSLARRRLGDERAALGFALAYLLYPAVQWLTLAEFHPVALATPLLLFAFDELDRRRTWHALPFLALAALTKEEVGLVVAAIGLWYALRRVRPGLAIAVTGAAWAVFAIAVVVPHFNEGAHSAFYGRYEEVGGSPGGIAKTAVTDPLRLLEVAFDARGVAYLLALLIPLLALPLLAPLAALVAAPELAINLLSATKTQTSIHYHYTGALIPALVVATIFGAAKLQRPRVVAGALVLACLVAGWRLGPLPFWQYVPGGEELQAHEARASDRDVEARRALDRIPDDAPVSATNFLGAHLSERERVFAFPVRRDAEWVAVDERRPSYLDDITADDRFAPALRALRRDRRFRLVYERDGILLFRRGSSAEAGTPTAQS